LTLLAGRIKRIKPSATLEITAKAAALRASGVDIIGMSAGEPDFDTPENIKNAAIHALQEGFTKYTPVGGIDQLKEAIINKLKRDNNLSYEKNEILVSCGAKHSLYNLSQVLFERGDEVIIPAPYWVSYPDQVELAEATPITVMTEEKDGFKLTPELFKKNLTSKTKALILNSPSNPTGSAYNQEDLLSLAEIALAHKIYIISDEVYEKIVYDGFSHTSIASLNEEIKKQTIVVNGVSKAYSMTGWRIGYAAGPAELIRAMSTIQGQATSNPTSIAQKATIEALNGPQDELSRMVTEFHKRRDYIIKRLNNIEGISCYTPQGAFYVFPNVSRYYGYYNPGQTQQVINNSTTLTAYLLEEAKVAVVPGIAFGADDFIRLSFATSLEKIKVALDRIEEALAKLKPSI
jgi:aspartate aminotransferase